MSKKMWFIILFVVVIIVTIVAISNLNRNKNNQTNQTNQNSQIDEQQSITDINNKRIEDELKMNPKTFEH